MKRKYLYYLSRENNMVYRFWLENPTDTKLDADYMYYKDGTWCPSVVDTEQHCLNDKKLWYKLSPATVTFFEKDGGCAEQFIV